MCHAEEGSALSLSAILMLVDRLETKISQMKACQIYKKTIVKWKISSTFTTS